MEGVETHRALFGYELLSGPFDDPIQNVRVCFVGTAVGEFTVELVAPLPGATRTPIDRILEKGNTGYHVCYEVDDIEQTLERYTSAGCALISGPVPAVAFESRRIAWVLTPTRNLVELLEASAKR